MEQFQVKDTIAAISTPAGIGGIAVIRVSGPDAIRLVNTAWKGGDLTKVPSHTIHLGKYYSKEGNMLDEAVASVFIAPASFTGEDIVEISVHGSTWIQREVLNDLVLRGVRIAQPGEFTQRAFLNGKIDLAQAEGIADLIASSSRAAHDMAITQTKGTFSKEFNLLREKLIEFASLLELELDFSEEDVEFADRSALISLCNEVLSKVKNLASSYSRGAVLKNGVPVVIAGIPNAGKSSLLNLLLGDEKAIVTDIPGTTRDTIEDTVEIDGILYRFTDTAGLRETEDKVEGIGVERAKSSIAKACIIIWVIDPTSPLSPQLESLSEFKDKYPSKNFITIVNKSDIENNTLSRRASFNSESKEPFFKFSTKTGEGLDNLLKELKYLSTKDSNPQTDIIVTNARHYEALTHAAESLSRVHDGLIANLSGDFIAQDIREATAYLATITGNITTDHLLHSIFSRFCIGK